MRQFNDQEYKVSVSELCIGLPMHYFGIEGNIHRFIFRSQGLPKILAIPDSEILKVGDDKDWIFVRREEYVRKCQIGDEVDKRLIEVGK